MNSTTLYKLLTKLPQDYHPVRTSRMGKSSANSVVDYNVKVHEIDRLRVVDAGVIS